MSKVEITKISVVNIGGADIIFFDTNLPNPIWPFEGNAFFKMESATDRTDEFLRTNFPGIEYTKIKGK